MEFHAFIKDFKARHLDAQLTEKLHDLVAQVLRFSQKGKLTIEITLTPKNDGEMHTSVRFKMKAPERDTMDSIMFATPENSLIDTNPNQPELFEGPVKAPKETPRVVKSM